MVGPQPEGKTEGTQTSPVPKYLPYGPRVCNFQWQTLVCRRPLMKGRSVVGVQQAEEC